MKDSSALQPSRIQLDNVYRTREVLERVKPPQGLVIGMTPDLDSAVLAFWNERGLSDDQENALNHSLGNQVFSSIYLDIRNRFTVTENTYALFSNTRVRDNLLSIHDTGAKVDTPFMLIQGLLTAHGETRLGVVANLRQGGSYSIGAANNSINAPRMRTESDRLSHIGKGLGRCVVDLAGRDSLCSVEDDLSAPISVFVGEDARDTAQSLKALLDHKVEQTVAAISVNLRTKEREISVE